MNKNLNLVFGNLNSQHARTGLFCLLILQDPLTSHLPDQFYPPSTVNMSIRRKDTDSEMPFLFMFCTMSYSKCKTYIKQLND